MRKNSVVSILIVCLAAILFSGCTQAAPVSVQSAAPDTAATTSASPSISSVNTPAPSEKPVQSAAPDMTPSPAQSPSAVAAGYQVEVPYDMETEENTQKSVDEGHSPWRLDAAFVAQVFVSMQISPEGIEGDYPIPYEDFIVTQSSGAEAAVEVNSGETPTSRVYLKRLVRQEEGGIWTVVGYDPVS